MKDKRKIIAIILLVILLISVILMVVLSRMKNKDNNVDKHFNEISLRKREKKHANSMGELEDETESSSPQSSFITDGKDNVEVYDELNLKYNVSEAIKKNHYAGRKGQENKDIVIHDAELFTDLKTYKCYFKAKIDNNSKSYDKFIFFINFYREKNDDYIMFSRQYNIDNFKLGTTREIILEDEMEDFSNAYDFEIWT